MYLSTSTVLDPNPGLEFIENNGLYTLVIIYFGRLDRHYDNIYTYIDFVYNFNHNFALQKKSNRKGC